MCSLLPCPLMLSVSAAGAGAGAGDCRCLARCFFALRHHRVAAPPCDSLAVNPPCCQPPAAVPPKAEDLCTIMCECGASDKQLRRPALLLRRDAQWCTQPRPPGARPCRPAWLALHCLRTALECPPAPAVQTPAVPPVTPRCARPACKPACLRASVQQRQDQQPVCMPCTYAASGRPISSSSSSTAQLR